MKQYVNILNQIRNVGVVKKDRTGVGTTSVFNTNATFDLAEGFPLVTGKYTPFKLVAAELLWFLSGSTNIADLHKDNCHIWDEWADDNGDLGRVYGQQWVNWGGEAGYKDSGINQIQEILSILKSNPDSRRMVVTAWNPSELHNMALEPCHYSFQFYTREADLEARVQWFTEKHGGDGNEFLLMGSKRTKELLDTANIPSRLLSCKVIQRSCDIFLGVPFNIASYALLTHLIAHCTNMKVDMLHWSGGDIHIYSNHEDQVELYLTKILHVLPELKILDNCPTDLFKIGLHDFEVVGYNHSGTIKADVAV